MRDRRPALKGETERDGSGGRSRTYGGRLLSYRNDEINYRLDINVVDSKLENNFHAIPIDEKEFMK